jgi:hypothetical protein
LNGVANVAESDGLLVNIVNSNSAKITFYHLYFQTLAKKATKPNPFKIIPLQTTRKENNWMTEQTLAGAVVTLETERIKGSNP